MVTLLFRTSRPAGRRPPHRAGSVLLIAVLLLAVVAGIGGIGWFYFRGDKEESAEDLLVQRVILGPFEHVVLEQGTVESPAGDELREVRCKVKSRSSAGTAVLWAIDEGARVKTGDKLVSLDSSTLEQELVTQRIDCNTSAAAVVQADNTLQATEIARVEYLEGSFKQEEQTILSEIFVAEENLRRAQLAFKSTERLAAKGIVTALQLEGDQFAVDKAKNELDAAHGKLAVLRKYTKAKMLKQFDSDIAIAQSKWQTTKDSDQLETKKRLDLEQQIAACTIAAPSDGQVVFGNVYSRRGSGEFVLEPGAMVRERQVLIRLPDPSKMQIKALINESRVSLVTPGMPVAIKLDALKDQVLQGSVTKVNQYAEPGSWSSGNIKEYAAFVAIHEPPSEMRSGMNAEVRIFVERQEQLLQVPIQALYETKGHYFCLVKQGHEYDTRPLTVGSANDSFMTIKEGLQEGEEVVMNPRAHTDKLRLPELPEDSPVQLAAGGPRPDGSPASATAAALPGEKPAAAPPGKDATPGSAVADSLKLFATLDKDGDGVISKQDVDDAPADRREFLLAADTNGDGQITRAEFLAARAKAKPAGTPAGGSGANP